jgi:hypothetical protein
VPFATAEICLTEVSTEYDDAECRCKTEKLVISEGVQVAEPVEQVVTQPVEELVRTPEETVPVVPLPLAGEDVTIPVPIPIPIPGPVPVPVPIPVYAPNPPVIAREPAPVLPPHLPFPRVSLLSAPSLSGSCQLHTWTVFSLSILWVLLLPVLLPTMDRHRD